MMPFLRWHIQSSIDFSRYILVIFFKSYSFPKFISLSLFLSFHSFVWIECRKIVCTTAKPLALSLFFFRDFLRSLLLPSLTHVPIATMFTYGWFVCHENVVRMCSCLRTALRYVPARWVICVRSTIINFLGKMPWYCGIYKARKMCIERSCCVHSGYVCVYIFTVAHIWMRCTILLFSIVLDIIVVCLFVGQNTNLDRPQFRLLAFYIRGMAL